MSKRSNVPFTETVTLTVRVNKVIPFAGWEVNELYSRMTEALDLRELLSSPQRDTLLVERGEVRSLGRPPNVRLRPSLRFTPIHDLGPSISWVLILQLQRFYAYGLIYGLIILALSGTGVWDMDQWVVWFMSNLSHCTWTGTGADTYCPALFWFWS